MYVGNLSWETDSKSLGDFFSNAGLSVESAEVQYYGNGTRSKGWGLVTFSDSSSVNTAIDKFNDAEMDSRKLIVRADRGATQAPSKVDMDSLTPLVSTTPNQSQHNPVNKVRVPHGGLKCLRITHILERNACRP